MKHLSYIIRYLLFYFHKLFNYPFKYKLANKKLIQIYPKGQITEALFHRYFENLEISIFQRFLKENMTMVDVGANIGFYSLIASKYLKESELKIFSFEPSLSTFNILSKNLTLNKSSNVKTFNIGIGEKDEENILFLNQNKGDAENFIIPNEIKSETLFESNFEKILIKTLDNFYENKILTNVDFVKIDTEGYEYFVLKGAKKLIQANKNIVILLECTKEGTERVGVNQYMVYDLLKSYGLNIYVIKNNEWVSDIELVKSTGDIWACVSSDLLPSLKF